MDPAVRDEIKRLVKEAIGDLTSIEIKDSKPDRLGPKVLTVFHTGVCRLDKALEQIRFIGEQSEKLGVYRGESARSLVSIDEVKEKSNVRCFLDKGGPAGIQKVLDISEILILPTFGFPAAAKIANLLTDDPESSIVLSALMKNKKILAAEDGFSKPGITVNSYLKKEIDTIFNKLKTFGMIFCLTDQLSTVFKNMVLPEQNENSKTVEEKINPALKLITAKQVHMAADNRQKNIRLAHNGNITPLARDLAKEYAIEIYKCND
jgi:hypothetical protein